jgi:hypothetical protein
MGSKKSKLKGKNTDPPRSRYVKKSTFVDISSSTSSASSSTTHEHSTTSSENDAEILNNALINLLEKLEEISMSSNMNKDIHYCICDFCKKEDFTEYRYKCLTCNDYDLCGKCFEKRYVNKDHLLSHPVIRFDVPGEIFGLKFENSEINLSNFEKSFSNETHEGVKCDICMKAPIKGLRLKCDTCNDFDLCFGCYSNKKSNERHSFNEHPVIVHGKSHSLELDENNIEFLSKLGSGAFGTVHKAKLKNLNKIVACKVITLKNDQDFLMQLLGMDPETLYKSYIQEMNAYKELKGVNILKMFGHCIQTTANSVNLMIVTEFMSKGSLKSLLDNEKDLSYRRKFDIVCDIVAGMARIHDHSFIHRDIRPDNILIDDKYTAKIGDMGIAKLINSDKNTIFGCISFMPPEFYSGNYNEKLDVFTFGLTLNIIYNGTHQEKNPIILTKQAELFQEFINVFVDHDPMKRPESKTISEKFRLIKKIFDKIIFSEKRFATYVNMSTQNKNLIFKTLYEKIIKHKNDFEISF